ncbi:TadE/TadG family type IV pilus assembly protein [Acidocella sp.]|uniref:TadE/TadG family type IV pilus assembly protein n=1 Tax=Acidocella sp. TaxID=50710 RepID=UPI003CFE77FC
MPHRLLPSFWTGLLSAKRAAAAVEFALVGLACIAFLMALINLGLFGYDVSSLARAVQQTGRWAATEAAASYAASGGAITTPCLNGDIATFNGLAKPALPGLSSSSLTTASGTQTTGNMTLTASWSGTAGSAPGLYLLLTGTYKWQPLGFSAFGAISIPMRISSAATVVGSTSSDASVSSSCANTY